MRIGGTGPRVWLTGWLMRRWRNNKATAANQQGTPARQSRPPQVRTQAQIHSNRNRAMSRAACCWRRLCPAARRRTGTAHAGCRRSTSPPRPHRSPPRPSGPPQRQSRPRSPPAAPRPRPGSSARRPSRARPPRRPPRRRRRRGRPPARAPGVVRPPRMRRCAGRRGRDGRGTALPRLARGRGRLRALCIRSSHVMILGWMSCFSGQTDVRQWIPRRRCPGL